MTDWNKIAAHIQNLTGQACQPGAIQELGGGPLGIGSADQLRRIARPGLPKGRQAAEHSVEIPIIPFACG